MHFYYVVAASFVVLVVGIEHMVIASSLAALGAITVIALEMWVPHNTGVQPDSALGTPGFVINTVSVWVFIVTTVWFAMRETARSPRKPWRSSTNAPSRYSPTSYPRRSPNG